MFCKYKNLFGEPNIGFHKMRLYGFASNDLIGTIVFSLILAFIMNMSIIKTFVILFVLAQVMHVLFCVNTTFVNKVIGLNFE